MRSFATRIKLNQHLPYFTHTGIISHRELRSALRQMRGQEVNKAEIQVGSSAQVALSRA